MSKAFTKRYDTIKTPCGFRFAFYCDLCDKEYLTREYATSSFMEAFYQAQEEAQLQFNMCHQCGIWTCDEHYNQNVMACIRCAPIPGRKKFKQSDAAKKRCLYCGAALEQENCFCPECGKAVSHRVMLDQSGSKPKI